MGIEGMWEDGSTTIETDDEVQWPMDDGEDFSWTFMEDVGRVHKRLADSCF